MKITLDKVLESKGITPYALAKDLNVEPKTIYKLCKNETNRITFSLLENICNTLEVNVQDILILEQNQSVKK